MTQRTTYADMLEYLVDVFETGEGTRTRRLAASAVRTAYRDLPSRHRWTYLYRRGQIQTNAPYATGTIAYDHTGGASERMVTLTGGTWPTWAKFGSILIGEVMCKVATRESDTVITLDAVTNPGADVASGTAFSLRRSVYPLPNGFRKIGMLVDTSRNEGLSYTSPDMIVQGEGWDNSVTTPNCWTLRGLMADYPGQIAIELWPTPSESRTYEFLFAPECREFGLPPSVTGGTVSISAGGTTVTGTNTAFTQAMLGAVMRFSPNGTELPTGWTGDTVPAHEAVITAVASATSLTVDTPATTARSSVLYTISDPIDCSPDSMLTYFQRQCEYELANLLLKGKDALGVRTSHLQIARDALRLAMGADNRQLDFDAWGATYYTYGHMVSALEDRDQ